MTFNNKKFHAKHKDNGCIHGLLDMGDYDECAMAFEIGVKCFCVTIDGTFEEDL